MIPALEMNVEATTSTRTPSPCSTISSEGNASPPWLTKYTGPVNCTGSTGVSTLAIPITDAAGQRSRVGFEGLAGQAFCSVVSLEGSCLGSSTLTFAMFASLPCEPVG